MTEKIKCPYKVFELFIGELKSVRFDIDLSLHIKRVFGKMALEQGVYSEQKQVIIDKYAKKDKDGKIVSFPTQKGQVYLWTDSVAVEEEMKQLQNKEFEIDMNKMEITEDMKNDMKRNKITLSSDEFEFLEMVCLFRF